MPAKKTPTPKKPTPKVGKPAAKSAKNAKKADPIEPIKPAIPAKAVRPKTGGGTKTAAKPIKPINKLIAKPITKAPAKKVIRKAAPVAPVVVDEDAPTGTELDLGGCTIREARFVDLYLLHFNGSKAYIEAGYHAKPGPSAEACASRLLSVAKVRAFLNVRAKAMMARTEDEQDRLVLRYAQIAYADARELTEYRRGACRYCHGKLHRYQFTAGEWDGKITAHAERQEKAADDGKPVKIKAPDAKGGTGYDWRKPPHEDCPECYGLGEGREIMKDTALLSPAAVALYAGTEVTKDGIKIKAHDQMKALDVLAKYRKLYEDNAKVNFNVTPEGLDALFGNVMQSAHETAERLRRDRGLDSGKTKAD